MPDPYGPYAEADLLDLSVKEYTAELERLGKEAFDGCRWLRALKQSGELEPCPFPTVAGINSRHYVAGAMAPLVIDRYQLPLGKGRGVAPIRPAQGLTGDDRRGRQRHCTKMFPSSKYTASDSPCK